MDEIISDHIKVYDFEPWAKLLRRFWTPSFVYDTVAGLGSASRTVGLHDWFYGEHVKWNDAFSPVHFTQACSV